MHQRPPKLLKIQKEEESVRQNFLPKFSKAPKVTYVSAPSGVSTSTIYVTLNDLTRDEDPPPQWFLPISDAFETLAKNKVRKATLPGLLGNIKHDLSQEFIMAIDSVDKARNSILGIDQALIRMRDVIQQLWGALVEHTKQKCPNLVLGHHLELKKPAHRQIVASCLGVANAQLSFLTLLDDLFLLHTDLSPESKNMLCQDKVKLEEVYIRWILQIDTIVRSVKS